MNTLYVVATPLGNLEDITVRAIKTLLTVPVIACEDTRRTGMLIKILRERYQQDLHLEFTEKQYLSVRDWNEAGQIDRVVATLSGSDVALVSDAGTPLISDPGYKLVRAVIESGALVVPIPGPSAVTAALSVAGLPTDKFKFWGFVKKGTVPDLEEGVTHVFYESPERLAVLISNLRAKYSTAEAVAGLEMTKVHEQFLRGSELSKLVEGRIRGETVLLVRLQPQE